MRQFNILVLFVVSFLVTPALNAQKEPGVQVYQISAQQAVELALEHRAEILNAQLDMKNQASMNAELTGSALPQLRASGNMTHFFNIPVTVLPDFISPSVYNVLKDEGVKDGNGTPIEVPNSFNTFPAQFGTPWQASIGLSIQQLLFQPDLFVGLKARSTVLDLYKYQLNIQEDSVKSNVYRSYYGVLIAEKGLSFAKESEQRLSKLFYDQEQLFKNGFIEKLDIDKTQVSLNNIRTTLVQLQNLVEVGYAGLKFALAIPQQDKLELTDTLSNEEIRSDILALASDFKYGDRSELQALQTNSRLLDYQVTRSKLGALPTVAAAYNLNTSAQRNKFNFFDTRERWFISNFIGLNISVPLFDGNQRRNKVRQAQYALEKNRNTIKQFQQLVDFQLVASRTQLTNAIAALNNQEANKQLAEKVYHTTKIKYEKGLGSSFEVLQSETSLQDALNNYYQAIYNAIIAKIGYRRALGKL